HPGAEGPPGVRARRPRLPRRPAGPAGPAGRPGHAARPPPRAAPGGPRRPAAMEGRHGRARPGHPPGQLVTVPRRDLVLLASAWSWALVHQTSPSFFAEPKSIVLTGSQSQLRSGPHWTTRLTDWIITLRLGSSLSSAPIMGAAGWLAVL